MGPGRGHLHLVRYCLAEALVVIVYLSATSFPPIVCIFLGTDAQACGCTSGVIPESFFFFFLESLFGLEVSK